MNKVLIIEDEKNIRETIKEILDLKDYSTNAAENGLIGIAKAIQFKPDLIICDIMMPEMGGFETLQNIRSINGISNTPFVFLTAKTEKRDLREGMNSGADDFLNKPFNTKELLEVIELRINKSQEEKKKFNLEIINLKEEVSNLKNSVNKLSLNNSHVLKAPLLNILRLINYLIEKKEENSSLNNEALNMLKDSCTELSVATEEIEKLLNKIKNDQIYFSC
ncbi:response regulator [Flavobacteriales bacterium]|nr:response regulator [Flavobacteriales bacterium]